MRCQVDTSSVSSLPMYVAVRTRRTSWLRHPRFARIRIANDLADPDRRDHGTRSAPSRSHCETAHPKASIQVHSATRLSMGCVFPEHIGCDVTARGNPLAAVET